MNSGVKIGAKYKISSFIKYVFLIIMALFAGFHKCIPYRPGM